MEDDTTPGKVVEEFPPPPSYYKLCTSGDSFVAPQVPSGNPYLVAYSGNFAHIRENCPKYDENKNYKEAIKSGLQEVMNCSLQLVSNKGPSQGDYNTIVQQNALNLRTKLGELHDILHEYREAEAREVLIDELTAQVSAAESLEAKLAEALKNCQTFLH